jgi:hypothetical protein
LQTRCPPSRSTIGHLHTAANGWPHMYARRKALEQNSPAPPPQIPSTTPNNQNDKRRPSFQQQRPTPTNKILHPAGNPSSPKSWHFNDEIDGIVGHSSPTKADIRDLHAGLRAPVQQLQFPPTPTAAGLVVEYFGEE